MNHLLFQDFREIQLDFGMMNHLLTLWVGAQIEFDTG